MAANTKQDVDQKKIDGLVEWCERFEIQLAGLKSKPMGDVDSKYWNNKVNELSKNVDDLNKRLDKLEEQLTANADAVSVGKLLLEEPTASRESLGLGTMEEVSKPTRGRKKKED